MKSLHRIIEAHDGTYTMYCEHLNQNFHSIYGSIQESNRVFIEEGLAKIDKKCIRIFEVGLGTGLNALLSAQYALKNQKELVYHAIELMPVESSINETFFSKMNLNEELSEAIIHAPWNQKVIIAPAIKEFWKIQSDFTKYNPEFTYDLIYFDAFAPKAQPELWDIAVLQKIFKMLHSGGLMTTFCAQGQFKRNLKALGFQVSHPAGPHGKREITVALKP
ncbi:MAG: tRNA (5-methylaminomethyl-2-thiouridine)(34)-methyltransferase MnmD [Chitinophagales bacterium]|jgi:tRNA U34 5-methylaminomethyl-2-thiouridine-forming methyltransferase MnmC|nr:tRNA (5-methylaminomethyl-2-thiouridine)(34)-methyltransferase MnmD [Chitinophagales bacterium]